MEDPGRAVAVPAMEFAQIPNIEALRAVANITPSTGLPAENWSPANFNRVRIWSGLRLDDAQALAVGTEWYTAVAQSQISAQVVVKGLKLALSLKSMSAGRDEPLLTEQNRPVNAEGALGGVAPLARVEIPAIDSFGTRSYTLRAQQMIAAAAAAAQEALPQLQVVEQNAGQNNNQQLEEDNNDQKRNAYCFLAMYMMKIVSKSPENLANGLRNMKERFESFYGPSSTVAAFNLTVEKATAYREALQSQANIAISYTHAVANTHQNHYEALDPKEAGVLSYLCFLPLSYMGLHAYTLMLELMSTTNINLSRLLNMFYVDVTAPAILKIVEIVQNFERTTAAVNRDVTFRYCPHWGAQYFSVLKSKNCPHLLYTIACTWKELNAAGNVADPERIFATNKLSASMKETLKYAGRVIGKTLQGQMLGGQNASPAFALAIGRARQNVPEEEESEDSRDTDSESSEEEGRYF